MAKIVATPWSNVNCETDIINALVWNRWILRILGVWPLVYPNAATIERIQATVSFALCWTGLGFLLVPMTVYALSNRNQTSDKIKMLGPLGYVLLSLLKYFFLVIRHRDIRQCIRVLSVDWRAVQQEDHREIMMKSVARGHVLSKCCIVFMYSGGLFYNAVMPFLSERSESERNVTVGPIVYYGFDIVFDLRFMPAYVFVYCAQCFSNVIMFNISTAVCCLAAMCVVHACGQIEIVMARLERFVRNVRDCGASSKRLMAVIVKHHVQALRFSASIEDILREICLIEIMGSTLIICLLEYYCISEWNNSDGIAILTYFFLLVSFVFNIFMFCYIGELLTDQCSKVGHTSYKIKWYHLPEKVSLDLILIINMSHHPIKITAGKLINLSFSSFGSVLKTSIAYLNLLRTFV